MVSGPGPVSFSPPRSLPQALLCLRFAPDCGGKEISGAAAMAEFHSFGIDNDARLPACDEEQTWAHTHLLHVWQARHRRRFSLQHSCWVQRGCTLTSPSDPPGRSQIYVKVFLQLRGSLLCSGVAGVLAVLAGCDEETRSVWPVTP